MLAKLCSHVMRELPQNPRPVRPLIEASRGLSFIVLSNARRRKQRHMPVLLHRGGRRAAKRPARTGRGDRRRRGVRHRPGERRQVGRLSAPHALLGAPTQSPAAAPPLANLISSRYLVISPLPIDYPVARDDWRLGLAGPRGSVREQICLLCAVRSRRAANAPAPRRRRTVHS